MKKKLLSWYVLFLLCFSLIPFSADVVHGDPYPSGGNIVGDTVYWENSYANLSVYPHTSSNIVRQTQWANLTWKESDNVIDVAFRFNDSLSYGKIWRWNGASWISVSMSYTEYNGKHYYYYAGFNVVQDTLYRFKWSYDVIANTSGKWDLFAKLNEHTIQQALDNDWYVTLDPWWSSSWSYYRLITISDAYIDNDLSNFPVLVNVSAAISARCNSGNSIRFLNIDNATEYYYEIEDTWNAASYNFVWVNITSISSSADTHFLMYYGNGAASDNQSSVNVWDSGYKLVSHLNTSDSTTLVVDSTSNRNNGSKLANAEPAQATGNIGYGQNYDGDDDNISYSNIGDTFWGFELWIKPSTEINWDSSTTCAINIRDNSLNSYFGQSTGLFANETFCFGTINNNTRTCISENITATWHLLAASWNGSGFEFYLDGVNLTEFTYDGGSSRQTMSNVVLGNFSDTNSVQDMDVDEFRVSIVKRNDSWMKAIFHSGNQTSGFLTWDSEQTMGCISTDTTTDITNTTAQFHGYIRDNITLNGDYSSGFWYGVNTSLVEGTYDVNVTEGLFPRGINFVYNATGLTNATKYYVRAWISNATFWAVGSTVSFTTNGGLPIFSNVFPSNHSNTDIDTNTLSIDIIDHDGDLLDWTIEIQPDVGSNSGNDDTNGTKTCTVNLNHSTNYIWYVNATDSYGWTNHSYNFTAMVTYVAVPTNGTGTYHTGVNYLNLSWDNNSGISETYRTDNYVFVQRNDTYSTSATQSGNWIRQNASTAYINISWTETSGGYFTIFSYNSTANMYSYNNATPLGLNIPWGALAVNVYNESNSSQGITFNIEISNSDSTDVYYGYEKTNTLYLDLYDIPYGDDTIFVITASGYRERTFYYDLELNNFYNYSFWLPPYTTPSDPGGGDPGGGDDGGGGNVSTTRLYFIQIVNELNQPIADTEIQIRKYINATSQYKNLTILNTDGYGYASAWLIPNSVLRLFVFADGYEDAISEWITDPVYYGLSYPKIIQMEFIDVEPTPPVIEPEEISFTGYIEDDILYLTYLDNTNQTLNTQIYIYEIDSTTGDTSLNYTDSKTSNMSFTISITVNTSNSYVVHLFHNHTTFGGQKRTLTFDAEYISTNSEEKLDSLLDVLIGENMFGWCNLLIFLFLVTSFYYTDEKDASKILIILGGIFLFLNLFFGFASTLFTVAGGVIPTLFIVVGVITAWNDYRKTRGIIG